MSNKTLVTVYSVRFKGIFGRNRSVKVHYGRDTVGRKTLSDDFLQAYAACLVDAESAKIKPKQGIFTVVRYEDCESDTYDCGVTGQQATSLVIPITQGVTVYKREVA